MKQTYLLGLLIMVLIVMLPASEAMVQVPGKPLAGIVTKNQPFTYVDNKVNLGEVYEFSLVDITMQGNRPFANLIIKVYDKNGVLQMQIPWKAGATFGFAFNGGKGPRFTVEKILPSRCLPRTNKCSEDSVLLSVV